ncbi:MAG TPA: glycosyltransferase [Myxococcales bacterium]|jgi:glycosyltransferase involved in cell wall biosynthesis
MKIRAGIHVHEEPRGLRATLSSIAGCGAEVVLLPDGPDEAVRGELRKLRDLPQLATAEPRGAPACFNRFVQSGEADLYILIESGSRVARGALQRLAGSGRPLCGPSTNAAWNEQCVFPGATAASLEATAREAQRRFGDAVRTLGPLHSLADFCYAVRREVIDAIGLADEGYGLGPCWELDYNVRAQRAGFEGAWVCAAYVHRSPFTRRRKAEEARLFDANRRRYQDKFCGRRLAGEAFPYEPHCKGDACEHFAPRTKLRVREANDRAIAPSSVATGSRESARSISAGDSPAITCILPTRDRAAFLPHAIRCFLRQDVADAELLILDDGKEAASVAPHPRIRYLRREGHKTVGAKRNELCQLARGDIIVHWDDDDWYAPDRLRRQIDCLRGGAELCGSAQIYFFRPWGERAWRYHYRGRDRMLAGTTLAYRKRVWARAPFADIQIGEDVRFVRSAGKAVVDLADPSLFVATVHGGNTSPKLPDAAYWQPTPVAAVHALLGEDAATLRAAACPLVSCIMPTRDRRRFVELSLRLFAAQDWPRRELIVVDDGTDSVADLASTAGVRYLRLARPTTIGAKRNLACGAACGEIVVHWDDDDWYGAERLSRQATPIANGDADLTGLENRFTLDLPSASFWTVGDDLHRRMFVGDVHGGTLAYRRSIFSEGVRYPEANLAEDAGFLREALRRRKRLLRVANPQLFVYIRHGRNAWRFETGRFLDPAGWQPAVAPEGLPADLLAAYRAAATL